MYRPGKLENVGANGGSPDIDSSDSSSLPISITSALPQRKNIRLRGYDYAVVGAYFITLCSHDKKHIFGQIRDNIMHLSVFGKIVAEEWQRSGLIRKEVALDEFVVMPNHFHGIVIIMNEFLVSMVEDESSAAMETGDPPIAPTTLKPKSLGALIAGFKQAVTLRLRAAGFSGQVWQRGYYDHVIRNDHDYNATKAYIIDNPLNWDRDRYS
ncbi:MAG: hypothetical protein CVU48_05080 [Candidatus Cloacimonetes bacterium HGW-Cloacimonetes-1]|jgi:REP element-mobilizing transposase RayT|nr:MAG: hypothetical protein CVU48_05080 [Candidatus Cloacimonetes bacterium HGW-Cloacimonetes-1]